MKRILLIAGAVLTGVLLVFSSCRKEKAAEQPETAAQEQQVCVAEAPCDGSAETVAGAIANYVNSELARNYEPAQYGIPSVAILAIDETDPENIAVWGLFRVFNYDLDGKTLKTVSGGSYPGKMILKKNDDGKYVVTGFEAVGDGSEFEPTARKIFGDKYGAFLTLQSNEKALEVLRAGEVAKFVKEAGLAVKAFQDYGWDPVTLPSAE